MPGFDSLLLHLLQNPTPEIFPAPLVRLTTGRWAKPDASYSSDFLCYDWVPWISLINLNLTINIWPDKHMEILISHEEGVNSQLSTKLPVKIQSNKTQKQRWPARSAFPLNLRWQEPSVEQHVKFTVWLYFCKKLFKQSHKQKFKTWALLLAPTPLVHCPHSCYTFYTRESKTTAVRSIISSAIHP